MVQCVEPITTLLVILLIQLTAGSLFGLPNRVFIVNIGKQLAFLAENKM